MMREECQALRNCLVIVLILYGLFSKPGIAQETKRAPLSEKDVLALATSCNLGEISSSRVVELIQERGLDFAVSDFFLQKLDTLQTDPAIAQTLKKFRDRGKALDRAPARAQEAELSPAGAATPLPPTAPPSKIPDDQTWPQFLEAARAKALAYTDDLPNFICTQITTRSERIYPRGWHQVDNFVADLTYFEKKENYRIISVANQPTATATMESLKGSWSTGEFGSSLRMLFDPQSNAAFRLEGVDQTNGHETIRISYQVPKETSGSTITYNNERTIVTAYRGRCWIEPESFNVVRLEEKAINIPEDFPINRAETTIDYDVQDIAGRKCWLPVRAEILLVERTVNHHARNVIEFKKYRKFEAEVRIVPE
jgi:hypothetical protein